MWPVQGSEKRVLVELLNRITRTMSDTNPRERTADTDNTVV